MLARGSVSGSTAGRLWSATSAERRSAISPPWATRPTSPARLQTYAPEGSVVIGASTYDLIRGVAQVRPLGAPELKGKSQPVEVYKLVSLRGEDQVDPI